MALRILALLLVLAVVPTAELVEQSVHVVAHALEAEPVDHDAHHDDSQSDEHGCTGLVHLCACHQVQVTQTAAIRMVAIEQQLVWLPSVEPRTLSDQQSLEPPHRPPIA